MGQALCDAGLVVHSTRVFKIKLNIFFGYSDPDNIVLDNGNKQISDFGVS